MKSIIMKKYLIILLSGVLACIFSSCEKLEPQIFDRLSPSNYPQNAEDARTLVTGGYGILNRGSYSGFGDISWQSRFIMNEATTDEFVCYWGGGVWETYDKFLWNSNSEHVTAKTYGPYIKAITNCININEQLQPIDMNADLKARYQAEMKGVIALLAYTLYDFYGPTAIVTDPAITLDANTTFQPERPTKEWMVDFIKTTARQAADALPVTYPAADYGRITKGTALMVLLKLAMHDKDWTEAAKISKEMMDLNVYHLQSSYQSVFTVDNEMNDEIVFGIPCMVGNDRYNNWLAHTLPSEYVEPNDIPVQKWGGYKVPWKMYDKFQVGDERLQSLWGSINTTSGMKDLRSINESWAQMGAVPYKYPADPASTGEAHGNDWVIYRYSDVLLSRAEALNMLEPLNSEAIGLINEVRGRAKAAAITAGQFANGNELNDFILDERFRELFMEGHRREDLIRHGKYLSEAESRGASYFDATRLIFPIPQWAINENKKITQNAGY